MSALFPILAAETTNLITMQEMITHFRLNEPLTYLGLTGNLFWFLRFFHQWLASERKKENVFPIAFWYYSLLGTLCLGLYFIIEQNVPGMLAYVPNGFVYVRNLQFALRKRKAMLLAGSQSEPPAAPPTGH